MLRLQLSRKELEKGKLLKEEDWFIGELTGIRSKESKDKESTNYFLEYTGRSGEATNVVITRLINDKLGLEPLFAHIQCLTGQEIDRESEEGLDMDLHELTGLKLDMFVTRGEDMDGNPANIIKKVAPLGTFTGDKAVDA
jgi:hypothetical protein